ncbi:phosphatase PAP2 family protein [Halovenus sp. WSH3]|uniref:Phosphatase PAP2 family protein n=1 Tax=Halovenus carboxidivorans TaxID=2692199 RepID=A0A6B0SXT5_9EURY|nr:phosphatase PAP2 family protein [Halovenus carboxidivorans]MXR50548.1 phosphatase PAP2 family protein [Halovenus carboxidivorans]
MDRTFSGALEFVTWLDHQVVEFVLSLRHPLLTKLMTSVTGLGSATAALAFLAVCYLADWEEELYTSALAFAITGVVVGTMMTTVQRPFPPEPVCMTGDAGTVATSFPSGHAAAVTVYAMTARDSSVLPFGAVSALAGLIAVSRIYLGTHYFSDTVAGIVIGIGAFYTAARLRQRIPATQLSEDQ